MHAKKMFSLAGEGATYTYARTYNLADWQPVGLTFFLLFCLAKA